MKIIKKGDVYQLVLPEIMVVDLGLVDEGGQPLTIIHSDEARLETLFCNILLEHKAWLIMAEKALRQRRKWKVIAISSYFLVIILTIFHRMLIQRFSGLAVLLWATNCLMAFSGCICLFKWQREPKKTVMLASKGVVDLRERITQQYQLR